MGVLDLSPEDGLPSGDHLLGVGFLFLGGLVGLLDDRDLDLGFLGVELRLEAPSQLHGLLHAARVVVLDIFRRERGRKKRPRWEP